MIYLLGYIWIGIIICFIRFLFLDKIIIPKINKFYSNLGYDISDKNRTWIDTIIFVITWPIYIILTLIILWITSD